MITKLKTIALTVAAAFALGAPVFAPAVAYAAEDVITGGLDCGSNLELKTGGGNNCKVDDNSTSFTDLIKKIINIFSVIVGVIAVVMIIVGGLKYITSGGESSNVSGAKNTIIYAIVGLIIVALAQFIVHFVLSNTSTIAQ